MMDDNQKICLITGGSSGLGLVVSKILAQQDFKIILLCRDEKNGNKAIAEIKKIAANPGISHLQFVTSHY